MNQILSISAVVIAVLAAFYTHFNAPDISELEAEIVELRLEVDHLHTVDIELGDNLNARIDEIQTGVAAIKDDTVAAATAAAEEAAVRAEQAATAAANMYEQVLKYLENFKWPELPSFELPFGKD